jgi:hypothetical protein
MLPFRENQLNLLSVSAEIFAKILANQTATKWHYSFSSAKLKQGSEGMGTHIFPPTTRRQERIYVYFCDNTKIKNSGVKIPRTKSSLFAENRIMQLL